MRGTTSEKGLAVPLCPHGVMRRTVPFLSLLLPGLVAVAPRFAAADPSFETDIRPVVERLCFPCHNAEKSKGDLNLSRFDTREAVLDALAVWQRAGLRVQSGEMPPDGKPQPTDAEKTSLLQWIAALEADTDCDHLATEESVSWYPGYVMSRRLNRDEYENTLRDLLGLEMQVAELFPADGAGGEGFDNNGNALFLSAIQMEKYLEVSDRCIEEALPGGGLFGIGRKSAFSRAQLRATRTLLIPVRPGVKLRAPQAAETVIREFAERAWRRPLAPDEVARLMSKYTEARERGDGYDKALKFAFKAALLSPNFIFLAEPEPGVAGEYALGDFPLAARLSYFLWASMPDEELHGLAREGKLQNPEVLHAQVARMLKNPKADALGELFAAQWLGIVQLGETVKPDEQRFPEFDADLLAAMRAETVLFFNTIIREDRSLLELITADYTFANERLASLYGIDGVQGQEMRRVQLADARRGGVLGMAAVLTATSQPLRTSPVLRGKWVLEQILGDRVPPPPPGTARLPEDDVQTDGLTFRQRMEAHRTNPECASCHNRMDPLGFGLENFDPIGRWRAEQGGQPIDAQGVLPTGETFNGPGALKQILLARKDEFARNVSRKMLGYALGRALTKQDECVVEAAVAALQKNDYRPSHLITQIVLSYPFRHRYSAGLNPQGTTE